MVEIKIIPESLTLLKMTDAEYFSNTYKDYVSNSKLGLINPAEDGSEEKFELGYKSGYSDSFELGSAVHAMLLQPESFFISSCEKPTGKLGIFAEEVFQLRVNNPQLTLFSAIAQASETADYYSGKLSTTRLKTAIKSSIQYYLDRIRTIEAVEGKVPIYLSKPLKEKYLQCITNATANRELMGKLVPQGLLNPVDTFNEYAILCDLEVTDGDKITLIKFKAKP